MLNQLLKALSRDIARQRVPGFVNKCTRQLTLVYSASAKLDDVVGEVVKTQLDRAWLTFPCALDAQSHIVEEITAKHVEELLDDSDIGIDKVQPSEIPLHLQALANRRRTSTPHVSGRILTAHQGPRDSISNRVKLTRDRFLRCFKCIKHTDPSTVALGKNSALLLVLTSFVVFTCCAEILGSLLHTLDLVEVLHIAHVAAVV